MRIGLIQISDDYELIRKLDEGFFGEVWLAENVALKAPRALKLVNEADVRNPEEFFREAQRLDQLAHPNVVRIFDAGRFDDTRLFLAMEYLAHGSARPSTPGGFLPLRRAKSLLSDAARGLEYIHQQGFLHRDLKPGNILIGDDGAGKLSDFGLAERMNATGEASPFGYSLHLAPEEVAGEPASRMSDLYALGMTAYRLLNGDELLPPVTSDAELDLEIRNGRYPNRSLHQPFVTRRLRRVMTKAMSVEPSERYQTAGQFRRALEQCPVFCDWGFSIDPAQQGRGVWTSNGLPRTWEISFSTSGARWSIETRYRTGEGGSRRQTNRCYTGQGSQKRRQALASILSSITDTGR